MTSIFGNSPIEYIVNSPEYTNTLYLDRDGVINKAIIRQGKVSSPRNKSEFILFEDLKIFRSDFFKELECNLVIVTNQPDLTRGRIDINLLKCFNDLIKDIIDVNLIYICPHINSSNCFCRKPKTGMIENYRNKFSKLNGKELFIGDQEVDRLCAYKSKIPFILIKRKYNLNIIDKCKYVIDNFSQLGEIITKNNLI